MLNDSTLIIVFKVNDRLCITIPETDFNEDLKCKSPLKTFTCGRPQIIFENEYHECNNKKI